MPSRERTWWVISPFLLLKCFHSSNFFLYSKTVSISVVSNGSLQTLVAFGHSHLLFLGYKTKDGPKCFCGASRVLIIRARGVSHKRRCFGSWLTLPAPSVRSQVTEESTIYLIFEFVFVMSRALLVCGF